MRLGVGDIVEIRAGEVVPPSLSRPGDDVWPKIGMVRSSQKFVERVNFAICLYIKSGEDVSLRTLRTTSDEVSILGDKEAAKYWLEFQPHLLNSLVQRHPSLMQTGADPEIFVVDKNGAPIPAWTFLPSRAEVDAKVEEAFIQNWRSARPHAPQAMPTPAAIADSHKSTQKIFFDGFQAEFTIEPEYCHVVVVDRIRKGLIGVLNAARTHDPEARLSCAPVMAIPQHIMDLAPDEHVELGCMPSLNIYDDVAPIEVDNPRELMIRFAGLHVHRGFPKKDINISPSIAMADKIASLMMVPILRGLDDPIRRQFYGKPGEHRLPSYGIEYRVGSSAILCHPAIMHLYLDISRWAMGIALKFNNKISFDSPPEEYREIITNCDVEGALKVIDREKAFYNAVFGILYPEHEALVWDLINGGAQEVLKLRSIEEDWALNGIGSIYGITDTHNRTKVAAQAA